MELPALRRLEQRENLDGESYFGALADADEVTDRGVAAFSGLGDMFILGRVDELEHEVLHPVVACQRVLERKDFDIRVIDRNMADILIHQHAGDRKSVVSGKGVSVSVDLGGRRLINKKKQ